MSSYQRKQTPGDTSWFVHDRFGMFIHWGLYALPARHEWIQNYECIPPEKYRTYFDHFDPDLYDPKGWAKQAKEAGMKYVVITTKHHEGFCLFDSKYTEYKATNTKAGRDLLREAVDAFRAEGIRIGFYYSLLDWNHPEFPIDTYHPLRNAQNIEELNKNRDVRKYAEYMRNQLTELFTNYGKIDILWCDFSYSHKKAPDMPSMNGKGKNEWESEKLIETVRSLQPWVIINNRTEIDQDIWTPEQVEPKKWVTHPETGELVTWETCQTFSGSWGYHRDEQTWKSPAMLIEMLINSVSLGGNLIMNVGPTSRGYFDKRAEEALKVYADWMKYNSRSIYGCTMAEPEFVAPNGVMYTQSEDGRRLYAHLIRYPFKAVDFPGLADKVEYAQFLHDGSELLFQTKKNVSPVAHVNLSAAIEDNVLRVAIPVVRPDVTVPVIEFFLK